MLSYFFLILFLNEFRNGKMDMEKEPPTQNIQEVKSLLNLRVFPFFLAHNLIRRHFEQVFRN